MAKTLMALAAIFATAFLYQNTAIIEYADRALWAVTIFSVIERVFNDLKPMVYKACLRSPIKPD